MKKIKSLIPVLLTAIVLVFTTASTNYQSQIFTVNGSVTANGYAEMSWSSVSGAEYYTVDRLPVGATGYSRTGWTVYNTGYTDTGVDVVAATSGLCQIRYRIEAFDVYGVKIDDAVSDFITTTDAEAIANGYQCNQP